VTGAAGAQPRRPQHPAIGIESSGPAPPYSVRRRRIEARSQARLPQAASRERNESGLGDTMPGSLGADVAQLAERCSRKRPLREARKPRARAIFWLRYSISALMLDGQPRTLTDKEYIVRRVPQRHRNREPTRGVEPRTPRLRSECSGHLSYVGIGATASYRLSTCRLAPAKAGPRGEALWKPLEAA
jgi:hypothetical protein